MPISKNLYSIASALIVTILILITQPMRVSAEIGSLELKQVTNLFATRIVEMATSFGRTYAELSYGDVNVDENLDTFSISNIYIKPLSFDAPEGCSVTVGSVNVSTHRDKLSSRQHMKIGLQKLVVSQFCIPFEMRAMASMMGMKNFEIPVIQLEIMHQFKSGETEIIIYSGLESSFDITFNAKFNYLSVSPYYENGFPLNARLSDISAVIDNRGVWEQLEILLPKEFNTPESAGSAAVEILKDYSDELPEEFSNKIFEQIPVAVEEFVRDPKAFAIYSNIDALEGIPLNEETVVNNFDDLLRQLNLRTSASSRSKSKIISSNTVSEILSGNFANYSEDVTLQLAKSFLTGAGVPKNYETAVLLLSYLRDIGVSEAEPMLVEAYINLGQHEWAYESAQSLANSEGYDAAAYFSMLEKQLSLKQILDIQKKTIYIVENPYDKFKINYFSTAQRYFSGNGAIKSYALAYYWGLLALATGDLRAKSIVTQLEKLLFKLDTEARSEWQETLKLAQHKATTYWQKHAN